MHWTASRLLPWRHMMMPFLTLSLMSVLSILQALMKQRTESSRLPSMKWQLEWMTQPSAYLLSFATTSEMQSIASRYCPVRDNASPFLYCARMVPIEKVSAYSKRSIAA
jgi:hypothetical protein